MSGLDTAEGLTPEDYEATVTDAMDQRWPEANDALTELGLVAQVLGLPVGYGLQPELERGAVFGAALGVYAERIGAEKKPAEAEPSERIQAAIDQCRSFEEEFAGPAAQGERASQAIVQVAGLLRELLEQPLPNAPLDTDQRKETTTCARCGRSARDGHPIHRSGCSIVEDESPATENDLSESEEFYKDIGPLGKRTEEKP